MRRAGCERCHPGNARPTPDDILVQGRFARGPALSIEVAGGWTPEATAFEVTGETGTIVLEGRAPCGVSASAT